MRKFAENAMLFQWGNDEAEMKQQTCFGKEQEK
jgi:hypothetical protein